MKKFKSRKFWTALLGFAGGLFLVWHGNSMEGTATLISSILGYMVAEGLVDAKAVQAGKAVGKVAKEVQQEMTGKKLVKTADGKLLEVENGNRN